MFSSHNNKKKYIYKNSKKIKIKKKNNVYIFEEWFTDRRKKIVYRLDPNMS